MSITKALGLGRIHEDAAAVANAGIVRDWLAALRAGTTTTQAFDAAIEKGFWLFQYVAIYGHKDELYPFLCEQIDRRMGLRGLAFCKWRGWLRKDSFDAWEYDQAERRSKLPNKGMRE